MLTIVCPVAVEILDRRRKFVTKNSYNDATTMIRKIDNGFHIELSIESKKEIYVTYKLQVLKYAESGTELSFTIPEFRAVITLSVHNSLELSNIYKTLTTPLLVEPKNYSNVAPIDKENMSPNKMLTSMLLKKSPSKIHPFAIPRRKQADLTPIKTGLTPNEKRTRVPSGCNSGMTVNRRLYASSTDTTYALSSQQSNILEVCISGANVFFSGGAGTGKSALLGRIIPELCKKYSKEEVFVTATTGLAACAIGGITVHQFAGMRPNDDENVEMSLSAVRRWKTAKVLIVDEISMMSPVTLERARESDAVMGGVQVIFCGDFFQLPPVLRRSADEQFSQAENNIASRRFCFQSAVWTNLIQRTFVLSEIYRQKDSKFASLLELVRWGRANESVMDYFQQCVNRELSADDGILPTRIFTHRKDVDSLNSEELGRLTEEQVHFEAVDSGESGYLSSLQSNCPAKANITLRPGAQVILLKSLDPKMGLVNGARGVVTGFTAATKRPIVRFAGGHIKTISKETFSQSLGGRVVAQRVQIPLDLAWAISVHKSQGMTVDKAIINVRNAFEYGQVYVALSRVKSIEGLSLSHPIQKCHIRAHQAVVDFYNSVRLCNKDNNGFQ